MDARLRKPVVEIQQRISKTGKSRKTWVRILYKKREFNVIVFGELELRR